MLLVIKTGLSLISIGW